MYNVMAVYGAAENLHWWLEAVHMYVNSNEESILGGWVHVKNLCMLLRANLCSFTITSVWLYVSRQPCWGKYNTCNCGCNIIQHNFIFKFKNTHIHAYSNENTYISYFIIFFYWQNSLVWLGSWRVE